MTKYAVIVAMDQECGFSKDNKIPWYFTEDFKHFRKTTEGHICVMGRKTYDDINMRLGERASEQVLPNRTSIVLSSQSLTRSKIRNAVTAKSWEEVFDITDREERTVFFIGGQQVFDEGLKLADLVYLTIIPGTYECDKQFDFDYVINNFNVISEQETESGLKFITLERAWDISTKALI